MNLKQNMILLCVFCLLAATLGGAAAEGIIKSSDIPSAAREMRAVWVATVANIDWPSTNTLTVDEQKNEAIIILDRVKALNMNAVVLQIRPHADAMYKSDLEPWSYYLTGKQGKAPEPFYDPLEFWVKEAHARGLELHTWFNPYRASHSAMRGEISPQSIIKTKPECVRKLGNKGYYWMDPSMKEVQDHSYNVVMDVVKRYDIDGVHFDDYFYPYRDYNDGKDFPDDETYNAYVAKGGKLSRGDWRRDAVNKFIERLYKGIKKEKSYVKFGISPFGIWKPGYPASVQATFDQYEILAADAKLWLNKGWIDYYTPQIYWNISRIQTSFPDILRWWESENTKKRNLWPGLYIRPETEKKEMALEIVNQIMVTRAMVPDYPGTVLFSMKPLIPSESEFNTALIKGPFAGQALIPAFPWLDNKPPEPPRIAASKNSGEIKISILPALKEKAFLFVLYAYDEKTKKWSFEILPENTAEIAKKFEGTNISVFAISAVDRCGNESEKKIMYVK